MLSQNDLSLLYKIISDKKQTFKNVSKIFNNNFNKDLKIKAATSLLILLEDNLLSTHQKIISYFILYDISKNEKTDTNPFLSVILKGLRNSNDKCEQNFLLDFLLNQIDYLDLTIDKYLKDSKNQRINTTQIQMQWDKYYKEILKQKNININIDDKTRPVIYQNKNNDFKNINNGSNIGLLDNYNNNKNEINLNFVKTNFMSYYPVDKKFLLAEPIWIDPFLKHNFIWEKK